MKHRPVTESNIDLLKNVFLTVYSGKSNAIHREDLIKYLSENHGVTFESRNIRYVIEYIRKHDLLNPGFIVSNVRDGYWYSEDTVEQQAFIIQELNRMSNQYDSVTSLHNRLKHRKSKQTIQANLFQ